MSLRSAAGIALLLTVVGSASSRVYHAIDAEAGAAPVILVQTGKGAFAIQTFPDDAPRTVAHIIALVRAGFYDRQRVHRALAGFVVQFGDPQTRELAKRQVWGLGAAASSGTPVGVTEISQRRTHIAGAVGLAHLGEPAQGDSQIYITLAARRDLDGKYAVFGQVVDGTEVPAMLEVGDEITRMTIRE